MKEFLAQYGERIVYFVSGGMFTTGSIMLVKQFREYLDNRRINKILKSQVSPSLRRLERISNRS